MKKRITDLDNLDGAWPGGGEPTPSTSATPTATG